MSMKLQTHKWKQIPLGQACSILSGYAWSSKRFNRSGEGIPIIRIQNVDSTSKEEFVYWNEDYEKRFVIKKGDVLLTLSGSFRVCTWSGPDALLNQRVVRLTPNQDIDRRWFLYLMQTLLQRIELMGKHALVNNVSLTDLRTIPIPLPPLPEQRRIAAILDKADAVRRKRQEAIRLTEEFLRSAFLEMFGDPVTNPKGWPIAQLHEICDEIVDCPHSTPRYASTQTPYPCLRSSDIQNGYLDWSTTKYVDAVEYKKRIERTTPITGDVIYCREGARFGNAARIQDSTNVCLGQRMMLFRVAPAAPLLATSEFLWGFMMCDSTYQQAVRLAGGSASPHVNVRDIKAFSTIVPPLELQESFSQLVKQSDLKRERYLESLRTLDGLFNALVQRAFRGEL